MEAEAAKIVKSYDEMIYKQRNNDDICISLTLPRDQIKDSTISYLNEHGYTCKLRGADTYGYCWHIVKDDIYHHYLNTPVFCGKH